MPLSPDIAIEMVDVEKLVLHPANPRQGDIGAIFSSIQENGWFGVLVAQRSTGHVLAGNHRLRAAVQAGITRVPVHYLDVDDDRALRVLLADNKSNDMASYNDAALAELLQLLESTEQGLLGTLYDGDDLDKLLSDLAEPEPELDTSPQLGDMQWRVVIDCDSEEQQVGLLERCEAEGLRARAVII